MNQQRCNQCENQCPVDALKCGRGRKYFGLEPEGRDVERLHGGEKKKVDDPIELLRQCGHALHHGGVTGDQALTVLSEEEQKELSRLLATLLADWRVRGDTSEHLKHHHHR